jgi:hypothetical protein
VAKAATLKIAEYERLAARAAKHEEEEPGKNRLG